MDKVVCRRCLIKLETCVPCQIPITPASRSESGEDVPSWLRFWWIFWLPVSGLRQSHETRAGGTGNNKGEQMGQQYKRSAP